MTNGPSYTLPDPVVNNPRHTLDDVTGSMGVTKALIEMASDRMAQVTDSRTITSPEWVRAGAGKVEALLEAIEVRMTTDHKLLIAATEKLDEQAATYVPGWADALKEARDAVAAERITTGLSEEAIAAIAMVTVDKAQRLFALNAPDLNGVRDKMEIADAIDMTTANEVWESIANDIERLTGNA